MTPLDFATERDDRTASWRRADPRTALTERTAWNRWVVTLPDGEHAHDVRLERDHGAYVGECYTPDGDEREPCPGNAYHDSPCAHLCTVRKAAFGDVTDAFEAIGHSSRRSNSIGSWPWSRRIELIAAAAPSASRLLSTTSSISRSRRVIALFYPPHARPRRSLRAPESRGPRRRPRPRRRHRRRDDAPRSPRQGQ